MSQSQSAATDSNWKKPLFMVWTAPAFLMIEAGGFPVSTTTYVEGDTLVVPVSPAGQQPAEGNINPQPQATC